MVLGKVRGALEEKFLVVKKKKVSGVIQCKSNDTTARDSRTGARDKKEKKEEIK